MNPSRAVSPSPAADDDDDDLSETSSRHSEDWTDLGWITDWLLGELAERLPKRGGSGRQQQTSWEPFCKADSDAIEAEFLSGE